MKRVELKVVRIGNSRGVRIPASILERYQIGERVILEERAEGLLLRPEGRVDAKLSWEDTARAMSAELEDWSAWETTLADGLDEIPWEPRERRRVAERGSAYEQKTSPQRPKKKKSQ